MATLERVFKDSIVAIRAPARLLAVETAEQFLALADDAIAKHGDVRLDLTEVTMMDACGVGVVAVLLSRSKSLGTRLRIDASPRVARLLRLTGLDACIARYTRAHVMKHEASVPGISVAGDPMSRMQAVV